jgi:pimeloyl-ACP methyl ester carboxylesterase
MKRTLFIVGALLVVLVASTSIIPDSADKVLEKLESKGIRAISLLSNYQNGTQVHILTLGNPTNPPLLLIHGSPGDWSAWDNIITHDSIVSSYYVLAVDRAGYGLTTEKPQNELIQQASVIETALVQLGIHTNITVVGHSYGAAVAQQLMLNNPQNYALGIFVAGTLSPKLMEPRWYNKLASLSIINAIMPKDLSASNYEMIGLPEALKKNEKDLNSITTPIVFIQGEDDVLVPFETADYYKKHKKEGVEYVLLEGVNHFIPWTDPNIITDILIKQKR